MKTEITTVCNHGLSPGDVLHIHVGSRFDRMKNNLKNIFGNRYVYRVTSVTQTSFTGENVLVSTLSQRIKEFFRGKK